MHNQFRVVWHAETPGRIQHVFEHGSPTCWLAVSWQQNELGYYEVFKTWIRLAAYQIYIYIYFFFAGATDTLWYIHSFLIFHRIKSFQFVIFLKNFTCRYLQIILPLKPFLNGWRPFNRIPSIEGAKQLSGTPCPLGRQPSREWQETTKWRDVEKGNFRIESHVFGEYTG